MAPQAALKNMINRNKIESMAMTEKVNVSLECRIFRTEKIYKKSVKVNAMQSGRYETNLQVLRHGAVFSWSPKKPERWHVQCCLKNPGFPRAV